MYQTIMTPVDLEHRDQLKNALAIAADLAKHYGAALYVVGVTTSAPSAVAHNPTEYGEKLDAFAKEQTALHGVDVKALAKVSHDPAADLDDTLEKAASEIDSDLIVMASHVPGFTDYIFASRAGYLASHSHLSVFVVR
ncbi:MAG: universal stress protein [Geminicoccaceae bacterium]